LLTTGPAFADKSEDGRNSDNRREAMFKNLDANDDGTISKEEFANPHAKHFKQTDTDKNGSISLAEFEAKMTERAKSHAKRIFERLDANNDGAVDEAESAAHREHRYGRMGRQGRHMMHHGARGHGDREHGAMSYKRHDDDDDRDKKSR
jgi:Ca2+-binding EF-hand superfamily protein